MSTDPLRAHCSLLSFIARGTEGVLCYTKFIRTGVCYLSDSNSLLLQMSSSTAQLPFLSLFPQPLLFLLQHPRLTLDSFRDHFTSLTLDLPASQFLRPTHFLDRLQLHEPVLVLFVSVKLTRLHQGHRRICDDPGQTPTILRRRMDHQRMQEDDIAHGPGHFVETFIRTPLHEPGVELESIFKVLSRRCFSSRRADRRHSRQHALRVVVQIPRDLPDPFGADPRPPAVGQDVREQRDDKQSLLRRVEEVDEKIAVDVPAIQLLGMSFLALVLLGAQIDDERVSPGLGRLGDSVFAADDLADGFVRLGRKIPDRHAVVRRHVRPLLGPGLWVLGVEPKPCPDVLCPFLGRLARETARYTEEAMFHE